MVTRFLPALNGGVLREVDQWFDRVMNDGPPGRPLVPAAVWEDENATYVELELPGVKKDELEIVIENGLLSVAAERKAPEGERRYLGNEHRFGRFERSFRLADTLDPDSIKAELADGVLRLSLSKKPQAQPRRIEVHAG